MPCKKRKWKKRRKKKLYSFFILFWFIINLIPVVVADWYIIDEEGDGITDNNHPLAGTDSTGAKIHSSAEFHPNENFTIIGIDINTFTQDSTYECGVSIYIDNSTAENTPYTDGTLVKDNWTVDWTTGWHSILFDTSYNVINGDTYEIQFVTNISLGTSAKVLRFYTDTSPASTYYYWVHSGQQSDSVFPAINFTYAPKTPTGFTCVNDNAYQVNLSWTKNVYASHTVIERNTVNIWARGSGTEIYNDTGSSYIDTSMNSGGYYYYRAWSYSNLGNNYSIANVSQGPLIVQPEAPTSVSFVYVNSTTLNLTWTKGIGANNTVVVSGNSGFPSSVTDGTVLYNNTDDWYLLENLTQGSIHYIRLWSWSENFGLDTYSSNFSDVNWGGLVINVYDENNSNSISDWDVFISNQAGTQTYEAQDNTNGHHINTSVLPYGNNVRITLNANDYNSKIFTMNILLNHYYILNAYLSETNGTELYFFYVIDEANEPVIDTTINVLRYVDSVVGYENVSILLSDANGQFSLYLVPDQQYLMTISKTGYDTEYSNYIPDPEYYGPYYPTTFMIHFTDDESYFIHPDDIIDFNGTISSSGVISVWYDDILTNTTDTAIYIYQLFNGTLTLNHTDSRTGDNSFTFTDSGYNTSMVHKVTLYLNHTNLGTTVLHFFLYPIRSDVVDESTLEKRFTDVYGDLELGWVRTFIVFVPCIFFLIAFGNNNVGLGMIISGLYLGFSTYMIDMEQTSINGEPFFIILACLIVLSGFLMVVKKRGRNVV